MSSVYRASSFQPDDSSSSGVFISGTALNTSSESYLRPIQVHFSLREEPPSVALHQLVLVLAGNDDLGTAFFAGRGHHQKTPRACFIPIDFGLNVGHVMAQIWCGRRQFLHIS